MSRENPNPSTLDRELLALPTEERTRLIQLLWDSVELEEDPDAEAAWAGEIVRRVEDARAHPEDLVPWEEVEADLQDRLRRR